ncbi:glycoside hydrolase family 44 protein [soil metagenome]
MYTMTAAALLALSATFSPIPLTIKANVVMGTISPYVYGTNQPDWASKTKYLPFFRLGGNRWSAYNWETNASNAGTDWYNQNDDYMGGGNTPAEAVRRAVVAGFKKGAAALVTVPITGHVSADKNGGGDVNQTPDYLNVRFHPSYPAKGSALHVKPNLTDHAVYQDEFVYSLKTKLTAYSNPLWFSLDNEPDLWFYTHPRITLDKPTYASIAAQSKAYAQAIKAVAPDSLIFGPASYGWNGYQSFQDASDANGRFFLNYYLQQFHGLEIATGHRYLDVLDLHYYSEARGANKRVTEGGNEQGLLEARMQAPRSLWDPNYTEDSWISQWMTSGPIKLIRLMKAKINQSYPGTKLALTEWSFGGGDNITGGIATADALGIFGREGMFAASYWTLNGNEDFSYAAFDMFRNFDKAGGHFGDQELQALNPDYDTVSIYASLDSSDPKAMTVVVINKAFTSTQVQLKIQQATVLSAKGYQLTSAVAKPTPVSVTGVGATGFTATLPATSVTTYRCTLQ